MKLVVLVTLALTTTAAAQNSTLTISTTAYPSTTVVSALTTVCGAATVLTQNGNYYTCTEAMTLTITDCPCTLRHPSYFANISAPTSAPPASTTISISTITVPAVCPTTTFSPSALAQNAEYTPTCQAAAAAGGSNSNNAPLSTPLQGYAAGSAVRPSASQYAYTSAGRAKADASLLSFFVATGVVAAAARLLQGF